MNVVAVCVCLSPLVLGGCALAPSAGPRAGAVAAGARSRRGVLYDVVSVDRGVLETLLAQPESRFADRFRKFDAPARPRIAIGDTVAVTIWEAGPGGLFTPAPPQLPAPPPPAPPDNKPQAEQRRGPPRSGLDRLLGLPARPPSDVAPKPGGEAPPEAVPPYGPPVEPRAPPQAAPAASPSSAPPPRQAMIERERGKSGIRIPDQRVGLDGGITVPYAGRIAAAGRTPAQVERAIARRLGGKALMPQVLVVVERSPANSVTVAAEGKGARRVPLASGERLLQAIAAVGGGMPVRDTVVRLSRRGVSATLPYRRLVSHPDDNVYLRPGDVVTLVRIPRRFSVFGAAGRNMAITFDAPRLTLTEALAKSHGLRNDRANPAGVFLLRYEPNRIVRALGQPIAATAAPAGLTPVVYRFDLRNAASYFAARRFPVHDKDVIFVAEADTDPLQKLINMWSEVTGPVFGAVLTCAGTNC